MEIDHELHRIPPNRRGLWIWGIGLTVLVLGFASMHLQSKSKLKKRLENVRTSGYPVTLAELDQWYETIPENENAALLVIAAYNRMVRPPSYDSEFSKTTALNGQVTLSPEQTTLITRFLTNNLETLALVREAAALKRSRYPMNLNNGLNTLLPHLANVKTLAQQMSHLVWYFTEKEKPVLAVHHYTDILGLTRSLRSEPLLISQLVRMACLAIGHTSLERILNQGNLNDEHLAELSELLTEAEAENRIGLKRSMAGERAMGIEIFGMPISKRLKVMGGAGMSAGGDVPGMMLLSLRSITGLHQMDYSYYLRHFEGATAASKLPFPEALHKWNEAEKLVGTRKSGFRAAAYMISNMILPALGKVGEKTAGSSAQIRIARCALAIERFRLQNEGNIPNALRELIPSFLVQVPKDPFIGKPLSYKPGQSEYVLYSVGPNGADDESDLKGQFAMHVVWTE